MLGKVVLMLVAFACVLHCAVAEIVPADVQAVISGAGTHLPPPESPKLESAKTTSEKAQALISSKGDVGGDVVKEMVRIEKQLMDSGFMPAFVTSLIIIILSEIGDKTFFIAAILAMRHSPLVIFLGAWGALVIMTILSTAMGYAAPLLLPKAWTHYAGALLFFYFGQQLLREGLVADNKVSDELEETEEELAKDDDNGKGGDVEKQLNNFKRSVRSTFLSPMLLKSFTLTFVAEWGDRSQIATIALAASKNPYGVTLGGCIGHGLCTGMAVIGGRLLASNISERNMLLIGGGVVPALV